MESANFDHMFVDFQQAGGATPVRLYEWLDATMADTPGNPIVNVGASSGWSVFSRRADSLAGRAAIRVYRRRRRFDATPLRAVTRFA
jgi:hypothetical protein